MEVIDERGYLFGLVNIIDALVILLTLAVVLAGVVLVTDAGSGVTDQEETDTQVIVFRTNSYPTFVIDAIPAEGPVRTDEIVAVRNKSVSTVQTDSNSSMARARLRVEVVIHPTSDGLPQFKDKRLYVGRQMSLDLRTTIVDGVVIDILPES